MREFEVAPGRAAHRLYAHIVWPTLGRIPLVTSRSRDVLERHLIVLCRRLDAEPLCVRVLADRAHLLLRFKPGQSVAHLVSRLKDGSERALHENGRAVRWGRGYAVATVGGDEVRRTMRRIVRLTETLPSGRPPTSGYPLGSWPTDRLERQPDVLPAVDAPGPYR